MVNYRTDVKIIQLCDVELRNKRVFTLMDLNIRNCNNNNNNSEYRLSNYYCASTGMILWRII